MTSIESTAKTELENVKIISELEGLSILLVKIFGSLQM